MWWNKPKISTVEELITLKKGDINSIRRWIEWNIWYRRDGEIDHWQPSKETLSIKRADCEDYAVLYHDILKDLGFQAMIFCGYPKKGQGHAICTFKTKNGFSYTSDYWIVPSNATTFEDTAKFAFPGSVFIRESDTRGFTIREIKDNGFD